MEFQRRAPRRRILRGGVIDCTVRKISDTGAALEVVTRLLIPDRFTIVVRADRWKLPCDVVWRKQKRIGVAFE
jgi:PilZ domain